MATSTRQASISKGMQPSDATVSTIRSASCLAARIASPIASMSLTTPDAVSICATRTALMVPPLSDFSRASTSAGRTARRMSPFRISISQPMRLALSPQPQPARGAAAAAAEGEAAALQHQDLVALAETVGEARPPGAGAVGDVDVGPPLGLEDAGHVGEQAVGQLEQRTGIDVDRRAVHGAQHLVGHGRRPWNCQKLTPGPYAHSSSSAAPAAPWLLRVRKYNARGIVQGTYHNRALPRSLVRLNSIDVRPARVALNLTN